MRAFELHGLAGLSLLVAACGVPAAAIADPEADGGEDGEVAVTDASGGSALTARSDATLATPRPLAPLTGATVTANPPTFHWAPMPGLSGARIQICRERACRRVEAEIEIEGTAGKPSRALSPGIHYYRLFGLAAGRHGTTASAPMPFTVRPRGADVDTSWGSSPDFDGDGYADLAVSSRRESTLPEGPVLDPPRIMVYAGRAFGAPLAPTKTIDAAPGAYPGTPYWIANAGDVDGDGFTDLVLGTSGDVGQGRLDVFRGSPSGLGDTPAFVLTSATSAPGFAAQGAGIGDVNGDGYADVAVLEDAPNGAGNRVAVFYGQPAGGPVLGTTIVSAGGEPFGEIAAAGDVNGDGYADVLVTRPGADGKVEVHAGGPFGLSVQSALTITSPTTTGMSFGLSAAGAGDVDGDGYADVAIAEMSGTFASPWRVHVFRGGAAGVERAPSRTILAPAHAGGKGPRLAPAGDVNGDGFDDLLVGSPETLIGVPTQRPLLVRTALYFGSVIGPTTAGLQAFVLPALVSDYGGTFGASAYGIGDFDGDGYADLALGVAQTVTPSYPGPIAFNYLYVHKGTPLGAWAPPTFQLRSAQSDTTFGTSIAHAF